LVADEASSETAGPLAILVNVAEVRAVVRGTDYGGFTAYDSLQRRA